MVCELSLRSISVPCPIDCITIKKTSFKSYFLIIEDGARLEMMTRDDVVDKPNPLNHLGFIHLALA